MTDKGKVAVPVIDLFAGPGGLSEGFEQYQRQGKKVFRCVISIEKDRDAYKTLLLRTFYRQFPIAPNDYYLRLKGEISSEELYKRHPKQHKVATNIAVALNLSRRNGKRVDALVRKAIEGHSDKWVLLGGPPCQAYSIVGRARMKLKKGAAQKRDKRHYLYQEYLRILRSLSPPVFVMENVKGLLSSSVQGVEIFKKMLQDFSDAGYSVHSFTTSKSATHLEPRDFVIKCENYDIPQARHRVILLGIRNDLDRGHSVLKKRSWQVPVRSAIGDLPSIRSRLSAPTKDSPDAWIRELRRLRSLVSKRGTIKGLSGKVQSRLRPLFTGAIYIERAQTQKFSAWISRHQNVMLDENLNGYTLHEARSHMAADLRRYLFASWYAKKKKVSPKLADFPRNLRPKHKNVVAGVNGKLFSDRFRVQLEHKPASTVVSHISKDGHYYIHYDPSQCRSLSVREAARLQTFPDNYFFEGNNTARYTQIGNAVPPLLAQQLAEVVSDILDQI